MIRTLDVGGDKRLPRVQRARDLGVERGLLVFAGGGGASEEEELRPQQTDAVGAVRRGVPSVLGAAEVGDDADAASVGGQGGLERLGELALAALGEPASALGDADADRLTPANGDGRLGSTRRVSGSGPRCPQPASSAPSARVAPRARRRPGRRVTRLFSGRGGPGTGLFGGMSPAMQ